MDSSLLYDAAPFIPASFSEEDLSLSRKNRNKIDYSKFKTKLCRNYLNGIPCPFEDRCAFAHGETEANAEVQSPVSAIHASFAARKEGSDSFSDSQELPPPPSYEESVQPPVYPARFRHDPYSSTSAFTYE
ncbi:zinc finger protein ZFP1 [Angomonas deanei]|uniref:Zinc finger C-x8-C-x5-C-x3-H type (And similar), putative n=1 Tax=Angomonas deanei TaxID=59799 RepID=A0A7G2CEU6_9TRYP|nr:zinc finger protein ZFP1 [Angomonas deanei]CAD2218059.1 Zinc finger C-x8-C-x5-C-x3-H type (and similar), putative [Angomonas deanei]|eukprot:EPY21032.1 zinc finger protein ZFP1 [Angomonas deanei]